MECNRIFNKQPWNLNGALLIFTRLEGNECPMNHGTLSTYSPITGAAARLNFLYITRSIGIKLAED